MLYINHVTLQTGHCAHSDRSEVRDDVLALVAPWLAGIINSGNLHPMPVQELSHLSARATVDHGCLLLTVFAPSGPFIAGQAHHGKDIPLITLAVAQRSRQGAELWPMLIEAFSASPKTKKPEEPWLAVALQPGLIAYRAEAAMLADFERCVAWAWITRNTKLEATP
jgi:hypothetical protein